MFSPSPNFAKASGSWGPPTFLPAARVSAQTLASAASLSLHTSGGTPTAARSLLCTARKLWASTTVAFLALLFCWSVFSVLLFCVGCPTPVLLVFCCCGCPNPVLLVVGCCGCSNPVLLVGGCCCGCPNPVLLVGGCCCGCPNPVLLVGGCCCGCRITVLLIGG